MKIVAATAEMVPFLLVRVDAKRLSSMAVSMGGDPRTIIADSIARSTFTWCAMADDGPVWLGGVEPIPERPGCGYVWQTVTPALAQHRDDYLLASQAVMAEMHAVYPALYAWIEADNDAALKHILRMGGTVGPVVVRNGINMRLCERSV